MTDPSNMIRNIMFGCQTMPAARWREETSITNNKHMMVWSLEDGFANVFFLRMDVRLLVWGVLETYT